MRAVVVYESLNGNTPTHHQEIPMTLNDACPPIDQRALVPR